MTSLTVARILTLLFVVIVVLNAKSSYKDRSRWVNIVKGLRFRHFAIALPLLLVVLLTAGFLKSISPDWATHGWMYYVGGVGSFSIGGTFMGTPDDTGAMHFMLYPFFLLLWFTLPLLAELEERIFRGKAATWSWLKNLWMTTLFGLVHLAMGIPLYAGVALIVSGLGFLLVNRRTALRENQEAGIMESTRVHLAYNSILFAVLLILLAIQDLGLAG